MDGQNANNLLEFGKFRLDPVKRVLWCGGEVVNLPLKAIDLLCVLIENRGEVVTKEELFEKIWGESFVEDSVLTQNIYLIRKTFRENGGKISIKNVPRRGYLFDGEVRTIKAFETESPDSTNVLENEADTPKTVESEPENTTSVSPPRLRFFAIVAVLLIFSVFLVGAGYYFNGKPKNTAKSELPAIVLKAVSAPSAVKSLVVLPLKNADDNFGTNFSRDLSIRLGSFNKFDVKPVEFVLEAQKHGKEIKTDFVLDGNIEAEKGIFSAEIRLLDTKNNTAIRTDKFKFDNLIQLQDAIANQISKEIQNSLTPEESQRIARRLPTNLTAFENFQKGYALWRKRADGGAYFEKAIELDQNFARAYIALASHKMMAGGKGSVEAAEAEKLLQKAFELDDNLADIYAAQGFMRIFHHWDWRGAEDSLKNAIEVDTNNINAHHWLAVLYSIQRRLDEAKAKIQIALDLDPANPTLLADLGQLHYFAGEKDLAKDFYEQALAIEPNHVFANNGLNEIINPVEITDKNQLLEEAKLYAAVNLFTLPYLNVDPRFDSVRGEKQFQTILREINLSSE